MTIAPLEEIHALIVKMQQAKEMLETSDTEYFCEKQLGELNALSNKIAEISLFLLSTKKEKTETN